MFPNGETLNCKHPGIPVKRAWRPETIRFLQDQELQLSAKPAANVNQSPKLAWNRARQPRYNPEILPASLI
jgi:hypothetical protein